VRGNRSRKTSFVSRNWLLYLDDLIASAQKIATFIQGQTLASFGSNELIVDAVLFNLQIIGESAKKLPESALARIPEASGSGPARLRDLIAHKYFALDLEIIWEVASIRVPKLLAEAIAVRSAEEDGKADPLDGQ